LAYHALSNSLALSASYSRSVISLGPVCDQDSVMEFGLYLANFCGGSLVNPAQTSDLKGYVHVYLTVEREI